MENIIRPIICLDNGHIFLDGLGRHFLFAGAFVDSLNQRTF